MRSSSLSLGAGSLCLLSLAASALAQRYQLVETWQGKNFLDYFNFYTGSDPTNGFVTYLDQGSAESAGLVKVTEAGSVYLGVDHTTALSAGGKGRDSVRIGSKKYYDQSLVVADIAHMPGSICGTWPAFWSVGKEWPGDGEIDIIEGVNLQDHNEIVMHTSGTCSLTDTGMTGAVNATGCGEDLGTVGCVIEGHQGSYGTSFNRQGGGIYAMQWTQQFLKIWFFPRHSIPTSITKGDPDVSQFGTPMALVEEGCDVANSFKEQSFVFDVTFCGDWAGGVFGQSGCPVSSSDSFQSCVNYVAQNPSHFEQTYWEINSVKIYQTGVEDTAVSASRSAATHAVSESLAVDTHATPVAQTVPSVAPTSTETASTAGTVAQLTAESAPSVQASAVFDAPAEGSAAPSTVLKSSTTQYVTKFVTDTTTLCPEAEASTVATAKDNGSAHPATSSQPAETSSPTASASAQVEPPAGWHAAQQGQGVAGQQSTPDVQSASADAASSNAANQPASSATSTGLPTIIPAPGVVLGSASVFSSMHPSQADNPAIPASTGGAVASGSVFPGGSSTAVAPVFTGGAKKISVQLPAIAVVFGLAIFA
ncbi:uncharacterized protein N7459_005405 [Penicillium hispanicum]|uniref:uncharacterized protein n=1 Tax=Penicillium hispanicum TaxID=1080232 RepID=UPI0025406D5B|nr:uncharacterized protein N7459_005405 [Penicillium hispanicum]KAJ5585605.1 hypothetical protein N7459_005405 [Penicillium hispanicum]